MMKKITLLFLMLLTFGVSYGQSIFENPITGTNPSASNPYTSGQVVDANITVSGIGRGIGVTARNDDDEYDTSSYNTSTLDTDAYLEFTLTPNSGYEIDFISFEYNSGTSTQGPNSFAFRSSLDFYSSDIGTPNATGTTIDLSAAAYQNLTSGITFRLYAWGASNTAGRFAIEDFVFNGIVNALPACSGSTVTWTAGAWSPITGPNINTPVIIDDDYDAVTEGSFSACSLVVNNGSTLTVGNGRFIEVENDATVDGLLVVETQGNFVQNDAAGTFTVGASGLARVVKQTAPKADWFYYTYWSSPVVGATIGNVFPNVDGDRRFWFNAANFVDTNGDDIGENDDDWQYALAGTTMTPGVGYAATEARFFASLSLPASGQATFEGEFNTGDIDVIITSNAGNLGTNWNFIGNPYPSAIDFDEFYNANSAIIDGAAYLWSQRTAPSQGNDGNQVQNFSANDYAIITAGMGGINNFDNGDGNTPDDFIPSCQGFFIEGIADGTITFNNNMRMADETSNSQFFKGATKSKSTSEENKFWINLTSNNGVFNQVLFGYVDGATSEYDGMAFDAPRNLSSGVKSVIYTMIDKDNRKFAIQGKNTSDLDKNEIVKLGFKTSINVETLYTLSLAKVQGDFLSNNTIYLVDNLTNTTHNLSNSDYAFTSEVGEFNNRFEIIFNNNALSNDVFELDSSIKIVQVDADNIKFTSEVSAIKSVTIHDIFGRTLYSLQGNKKQKVYNLNNLKTSVYIATIELENGSTLSKKFFKK